MRVGCQMRERVYLHQKLSASPQPPQYFLPKYEVWIPPCLAGVHLVSSIVLGQGHFHELGSVEGEGEYGDGDDVDQQTLGVAHCLENISTFTFRAHNSTFYKSIIFNNLFIFPQAITDFYR